MIQCLKIIALRRILWPQHIILKHQRSSDRIFHRNQVLMSGFYASIQVYVTRHYQSLSDICQIRRHTVV